MGKNFVSYGDAETILTEVSASIKKRILQMNTTPEAIPELVGKTIQYTGADDTVNNFLHNYFYELVFTEIENPTGDPYAQGWWKETDNGYVPCDDTETTVDPEVTYGTVEWVNAKTQVIGLEYGETMPENPIDKQTFLYLGENTYKYTLVDKSQHAGESPVAEGWFERTGTSPNYTYVPSEDEDIDPAKDYYIREDEYTNSVIYVYSEELGMWVRQSSSISDVMTPITHAQIAELFN